MSTFPRGLRARLLAATGAAAALIVAPVAVAPAYAAPVTVDVLTINDFHGRIEAIPPAAGAAMLGGMVDAYEAANPNTIFAAAGDLIGASTFTSFIQDDAPTIDALNAIGLDVSAFGNHEFDQGRDDVDGRVLPDADWPYLAANLYDTATGAPAFEEYTVVDTGGVSVGFVGAVTEELPSLVSPDGIATLDVREIVPEVNRVAAALSDGDATNGEADVVILLVHEGAGDTSYATATNPASPFGEIVTGASADVDAIVSGHTHQQYDHEVPIPGTDRTRPVISAGEYGAAYGHLEVSIDSDSGDLLAIDSEVLPLAGFAPDPDVAQIVANAVTVANDLGNESLGAVTTAITRGQQTSGSENRGSESTLGNLIADAQLAATADLGTQVALMNPGGIRSDLTYPSSGAADPDGNVTFREAATVQPFANTLVTLTLTGAQLKAVLEQQWQPAGASRPFLKLGVSTGFEYSYDPAAATGSHITGMSLAGVPITPEQPVLVVTNSFLAAGGDNFGALTQGAGKADSGRIDLTAFVDFIRANSPVAPPLEQRSVGVQLSAPTADQSYLPGDVVRITLSSLLFSKGGPTTGDAVVSMGDTVLGSAPIGFAITDGYDEQGAAVIDVTIPDEVVGAQALTVTGPGGTSIEVPIQIAAPVETRVTSWPDQFLVRRGSDVEVTVRIRALDGSAPLGEVAVYDGRRLLATVPVTAEDSGQVVVELSDLARGAHVITARFTGAGVYLDDRSVPTVVVAV